MQENWSLWQLRQINMYTVWDSEIVTRIVCLASLITLHGQTPGDLRQSFSLSKTTLCIVRMRAHANLYLGQAENREEVLDRQRLIFLFRGYVELESAVPNYLADESRLSPSLTLPLSSSYYFCSVRLWDSPKWLWIDRFGWYATTCGFRSDSVPLSQVQIRLNSFFFFFFKKKIKIKNRFALFWFPAPWFWRSTLTATAKWHALRWQPGSPEQWRSTSMTTSTSSGRTSTPTRTATSAGWSTRTELTAIWMVLVSIVSEKERERETSVVWFLLVVSVHCGCAARCHWV